MVKRSDIQEREVRSGAFECRTSQYHDRQVSEVLENPHLVKEYGVKGPCVLSNNLEHFHTISGFPPEIMHNLWEGIIPVEMSVCINDLISQKYITLESVNKVIKDFPYQFTDRTDQPQICPCHICL